MSEYVVVTDPNADDLFRVHRADCADIRRREVPLERRGIVSYISKPIVGDSGSAVLEAEMRSDFSGEDGGEHPATASYPAGSYGAAGFTGVVLPCCGKRRMP